MKIKLLDCTLRDGGYYNNWDFSPKLVQEYLAAMAALQIDFIEIGFRSLRNEDFKGGYAFSTDTFISSLSIPNELNNKIGVMINGSELILKKNGLVDALAQANHQSQVLHKLFAPKKLSPVTLVRIACHVHEFEACLPASKWLQEQGYLVGFNLMQVTGCSGLKMTQLAKLANQYPIDILYFADSMGSLNPEQVGDIINAFKQGWQGELGIHTHDNMGQAIMNSLRAVKEGISWLDSTVTGMGRGSGNAQTEYLAIVLQDYRKHKGNITQLLELIRIHFKPLQTHYGWGVNPYYHLAGKHGIHPSYIQKMLADNRYSEEDILAVIGHLKVTGGTKFHIGTLEAARHFYSGNPRGSWNPADLILNKDILIIGSGPSATQYRQAIETHIKLHKPVVIALNTQKSIDESLINVRVACHPVRLLADCHEHLKLSQPLITPASMLPKNVKQELLQKKIFDFGLAINPKGFEFYQNHCVLPSSLVIAYALAIASSGQAKRIFVVGFDGYGADDPRHKEMDGLFKQYRQTPNSLPITSITPTCYKITIQSIYGILD